MKVIKMCQDNYVSGLLSSLPVNIKAHAERLLRSVAFTLKASPALLDLDLPASFLVRKYFCMNDVPRIKQRIISLHLESKGSFPVLLRDP